MIKKYFIAVSLFLLSSHLLAQIHRSGDAYCSDTVFLNDNNKASYYNISLVVVLDSVVSLDEFSFEYYSYKMEGHYYDPNLKVIDTVVERTYSKIMFKVKDGDLYFCKENSATPVFADLNGFRDDSVSYKLHSPYLQFGFDGSTTNINYSRRANLYSSVDINIDRSFFFKRIRFDFGIGMSLIEFGNACDFGHVVLYKR